MGNKTSVWPAVGLSAILLLSVLNVGLIYSVAQKDVVIPSADEIAAKVNIPSPVSSAPYDDTALVGKIDKIGNEVLKNDLKEVKALELINEELDSRDFKKELRSVLNDELSESDSSSTIEDYKDIVSIVVTDGSDDVTISGDDASVTLTLKVKYFLDGDTDEDDVEAAKLKVDLSVSDLDEDEEYIDAEVDSYSDSDFELVKFYEK